MAKKKKKTGKELNELEQALSEGIVAKNVIDIPVEGFLHHYYLPYSYFVLRDRALINTDGLKPVHKRILYYMWLHNITHDKKSKKAAQISGGVMGDFHPHGDSAIDDALARLAQNFNMRVRLVHPDGAVGSVFGDRAVASRYWEAKLTKAAGEMVNDLKYAPLPMGRNYDDTKDEPIILPTRWPTSIINGSEGIAVGYAAKLFPHNPTEVMDACIAFAKNRNITLDEILEYIKGPDFPTGGEIVKVKSMREYYETGKGTFSVRGRYTIEDISRGRTLIEFYELPFQVSPEEIIRKVNQLKKEDKCFKEITESKDLSDKDNGLRLQFTLKSGSNVNSVIQDLFKNTAAESPYSFNQTVLKDRTPETVGLRELIEQFIDLREIVTANIIQAKLEKAKKDLSNNDALSKILLDIDKALEIIKASENDETAAKDLIKYFKINEEQASYILSLQLKRITRSDRQKLIDLNKEIRLKVEELKLDLSDDSRFVDVLVAQLEETKEIIKDDRRTVINLKTEAEMKEEVKKEKARAKAISNNADSVVTLFADNTITKSLKGAYDKGDKAIKYSIHSGTQEDLFAVMKDGSGIRIPSDYIQFDNILEPIEFGSNANMIGMGKVNAKDKDLGLLTITKKGNIALMKGKFPVTSNDFNILSVEDDDEIVFTKWLTSNNSEDNVIIASSEGLIMSFPINTLRVSNIGIKPVKGMALTEGHVIVGADVVPSNPKGLVVITTTPTTVKATKLEEIPVKSRATKGVITHRLTKSSTEMTHMAVGKPDNIMMIDQFGVNMIQPPISNRATAGQRMPTGQYLVGVKTTL